MNYSIVLTLRYFIFYKQTQNKRQKHTHTSTTYTTLSIKDNILFPANIGLLILLLLLSLLLPATFLCIYTHSQSLCFPSLPFSHRALLQLTSLTYFTHPSLTLFYSLSFTISTNSQKTLLSLVHTRFSSFHHSQKTTFLSLSFPLNHSQALCHGSFPPEDNPCLPPIPLLIKCSLPPQKHCSVGDT